MVSVNTFGDENKWEEMVDLRKEAEGMSPEELDRYVAEYDACRDKRATMSPLRRALYDFWTVSRFAVPTDFYKEAKIVQNHRKVVKRE